MRRYEKRVSLDHRDVPRSETVSVICPIEDRDLSPQEILVPFVHNIADKDQPPDESQEWLSPDKPNKKYGKFAGGGLPTGGVEGQYLENPGGAAIRETKVETGITLGSVNHLFTDNGIIISDKRTGAKIRRMPYERGKQPSLQILSKTQKTLDNPIHVFSGRITDWSKLRQFLLEEKDRLIRSGQTSEEEIASTGIYVKGLFEEEYDILGIEEKNEIDGIALISVSALIHMWSSREYHFAKDFFVYPSHVYRTLTGLVQMGKLGKGVA